MMRVSLCLLTWNELPGCITDVPRLPRELFSECFAIDANSTDGTVEYLADQGVQVVSQVAPGYNAAYRQALEHFTGDAVVFFHPKGTVSPAVTSQLVGALKHGYDLVIASRMLSQSRNEEDGSVFPYRKWFGQGLGLAASLRWKGRQGARITDPLHGLRACSRAFANTLDLRDFGATADLEMVHHAYAGGYTYLELPVSESPRGAGSTHFPAFKTGRQLLRYFLFSNGPRHPWG